MTNIFCRSIHYTCNLVFTTSKGQVIVAPTVPPTLKRMKNKIYQVISLVACQLCIYTLYRLKLQPNKSNTVSITPPKLRFCRAILDQHDQNFQLWISKRRKQRHITKKRTPISTFSALLHIKIFTCKLRLCSSLNKSNWKIRVKIIEHNFKQSKSSLIKTLHSKLSEESMKVIFRDFVSTEDVQRHRSFNGKAEVQTN